MRKHTAKLKNMLLICLTAISKNNDLKGDIIMKKVTVALSTLICVSILFSFASCSSKNNESNENVLESSALSSTSLFTANEQTEINTKYKTGDLVYFGEYPSLLVSGDLETELNKLSFEWKSFDYYCGDGTMGSMKQENYMKYADVTYNGQKYRAVQLIKYRPENTFDEAIIEINSRRAPWQLVTGYSLNETYWFLYTPLVWRILDPETGFMICENIIDAQPFSNTAYQSGEDYYSDPNYTYYANDYEHSSIREWLNNDENGFYNTAFSENEKKMIEDVIVSNVGEYVPGFGTYKANPTKERVFLVSSADCKNELYNLEEEVYCTCYSWVQGIRVGTTGGIDPEITGLARWITRTPRYSNYVVEADTSSQHVNGKNVYESALGIRPAIQVNDIGALKPGKNTMKEIFEG